MITGYKGTDFPEPSPFILEIPNTPDNVEKWLPEIANFVRQWQGKRVQREDIYHLYFSVKEPQRLAFMESLVRGYR